MSAGDISCTLFFVNGSILRKKVHIVKGNVNGKCIYSGTGTQDINAIYILDSLLE